VNGKRLRKSKYPAGARSNGRNYHNPFDPSSYLSQGYGRPRDIGVPPSTSTNHDNSTLTNSRGNVQEQVLSTLTTTAAPSFQSTFPTLKRDEPQFFKDVQTHLTELSKSTFHCQYEEQERKEKLIQKLTVKDIYVNVERLYLKTVEFMESHKIDHLTGEPEETVVLPFMLATGGPPILDGEGEGGDKACGAGTTGGGRVRLTTLEEQMEYLHEVFMLMVGECVILEKRTKKLAKMDSAIYNSVNSKSKNNEGDKDSGNNSNNNIGNQSHEAGPKSTAGAKLGTILRGAAFQLSVKPGMTGEEIRRAQESLKRKGQKPIHLPGLTQKELLKVRKYIESYKKRCAQLHDISDMRDWMTPLTVSLQDWLRSQYSEPTQAWNPKLFSVRKFIAEYLKMHRAMLEAQAQKAKAKAGVVGSAKNGDRAMSGLGGGGDDGFEMVGTSNINLSASTSKAKGTLEVEGSGGSTTTSGGLHANGNLRASFGGRRPSSIRVKSASNSRKGSAAATGRSLAPADASRRPSAVAASTSGIVVPSLERKSSAKQAVSTRDKSRPTITIVSSNDSLKTSNAIPKSVQKTTSSRSQNQSNLNINQRSPLPPTTPSSKNQGNNTTPLLHQPTPDSRPSSSAPFSVEAIARKSTLVTPGSGGNKNKSMSIHRRTAFIASSDDSKDSIPSNSSPHSTRPTTKQSMSLSTRARGTLTGQTRRTTAFNTNSSDSDEEPPKLYTATEILASPTINPWMYFHTECVQMLQKHGWERSPEEILVLTRVMRGLKAFDKFSDFILKEVCGVARFNIVEQNRAVFRQGS
jgi:hypothetical protein